MTGMNEEAMDIAHVPPAPREGVREVALPWWKYLAIGAAYLVFFLVTNRLTIPFSHIHGISAFYPPAGLTLALLLLFGLRFVPVVLLATLLGEQYLWPIPSFFIPPLPLAIVITVGYTLAAYVLRRIARFDVRMRSVQDMAALLYIAIMAAVLVAALSVAVLVEVGIVPGAAFSVAFLNWWLGDAVGILAVTPGLLLLLAPLACPEHVICPPEGRRFPGWVLAETVVWLLGTLLIIHYVFLTSAALMFHLIYFVFLPLIWIGLRWGTAGATAGVFVTSVSVALTLWTIEPPPAALLDTQLFILVLAATGLLLGAVVTERQQVQRQYEEERALLASAVGLLPIPILFIDTEGCILRANAASREFFADTVRVWWEVKLLTADTHALLPFEQRPGVRTLRDGVRHTLECILALGEDREVPVLIHAAPTEVRGRVVGAVIAIQDITALKEADRAKNRFLDVLSHELKTPLTSIIGWTQAARDDSRLTPQAMDVIERNAQAQRRMLDDLLDVSRILHGKLELRPARVELWPLVEETATEFAESLAARQLTLTLEAPTVPLPIHADAGRIRQAIANLLDNAVKFTDPGGAVIIGAHRDNNHAVLTIRDTGRGIPTELLGVIFAPFAQIQRTEITGGLGLGLILVKGIIELHGGRVTATSGGPGEGSTFTITLPLAE